ncbi:MAG: tetratricopeptide repeat protein [Anaerolineae bacterium]|nr:tetratricopeptide repeat protein [Anaerolineae bacterium]
MGDLFPTFHWTNFLIIPGVLIGSVVHELGHAFAAYYLGDYGQVERGKITLNPMRHLSWIGLFSFVLIGIGWARPIEVNPRRLKPKYLGLTIVSVAGPMVSFTFSLFCLMLSLTIAAVLVYSSGLSTDEVLAFLLPVGTDLPQSLDLQAVAMALTIYMASASFWITFTSLIPLPGLDGFILLTSLIAYFRHRQKKPAVTPTPTIHRDPSTPFKPINLYERRNNVSDIHFKIGTEFHEDNKFDDAIARYRQAINNDQRFGPAYVNLGLAYLGKGKRREAIHAFRGAVQYADDQKSKQEAWYQLHQLSEVSPVAENAEDSLNKLGSLPWTDTRPRPNWVSLGINLGLLLVGGIITYGYVVTSLIHLLRT